MSTLTEAAMLDHLHRRYSHLGGNGVRYVCAEHVRSAAGFNAPRCADMIVQDLWPMKGLELIGHEVKVSRSDWQAELKDPAKAATFRRHLHRWYLVVPDRSIVRGDLPDGWGLMALAGETLRVVTPAALMAPEPMPATMTAALLRAVAKTAERRAVDPPFRRHEDLLVRLCDVLGLDYTLASEQDVAWAVETYKAAARSEHTQCGTSRAP